MASRNSSLESRNAALDTLNLDLRRQLAHQRGGGGVKERELPTAAQRAEFPSEGGRGREEASTRRGTIRY
ncbi:hypothetical protein T484DRAFT_1861533 [Baffinella frigidus]|nr:hypothetical protein T484DRAFT_1861533 [Cryptophyta sp. CCMP2293]